MKKFILELILGITLSLIFHPENSRASEPCPSPSVDETPVLNDLL